MRRGSSRAAADFLLQVTRTAAEIEDLRAQGIAYDGFIAKQRREERALALAKKADSERLRLSAQKPIAATSLARQLRREYDPPRDEDTIDTWMVRNKWSPVSWGNFKTLHDAIWKFLEDSNEKNKERNSKIAALEQHCAELESTVALAVERVKSFEERPGVPYLGIWDSARAYSRGVFVTHGGFVVALRVGI